MTRHPLLALPSSMMMLLLFLQVLTQLISVAVVADGGKNPCSNLSTALPLAVGYSSSQLIVITVTDVPSDFFKTDLEICQCLYQVPDYSVYGNKMYLTGGKAILDVWPELAGHGLACNTRGIVISDSQYTYLLYEAAVLFNIDKKEVVKGGGGLESPGMGLISFMDKMTFYVFSDPDSVVRMTKYIYGGSSLLEAKSASKQSTYTICGGDAQKDKPTHLVATKGENKCPFPIWWEGEGRFPIGYENCGFSDGKNFYIFTVMSMVHIFEVDAFEGKLGQKVPLEVLEFVNFTVNGSPPPEAAPHSPDRSGGHGKAKKTVIIVVMIILFLILCALGAFAIFCLIKRQEGKKGQSESKAKQHRKSSKKLSGSRSKSRVGGGKSRTGKLANSKKSSRIRKARSKRSLPVGAATSRSKGKGFSRTTTTASRKGMSRTTSAKASRTSKRPTV